MTSAGEGGLPRADRPVPSGNRWRNRFLLRFAALQAAAALLLLAGFHLALRLPFPGGYGDVFRAVRTLEARFPLLVALLLLGWLLVAGGGAALLWIASLGRVTGPLGRALHLSDDLASALPVAPVRFREGDAAGDLEEALDGFLEALRKDRDACLALLAGAARAPGGEDARREAARAALREAATILHRYR